MNCPECGRTDVDKIYRNQDGDIFGCEYCVREVYSDDYEIEQAEAQADRRMSDYDGWRDERAYGSVCTP